MTAHVRHFRFTAVDTLFFGDGRPFLAADEGLNDARSVFPPFPEVVAGALRVALARGSGWDGHGRFAQFDSALGEVLGHHRDDPGKLWTSEPVLVDVPSNNRIYPAPLHLGLDDKDTPVLLAPDRAFKTDRGTMRLLCSPDGEPVTSAEGFWLQAPDFGDILCGLPPDVGVSGPLNELALAERRVGIARSPARRTPQRAQIYAVSEIRPRQSLALGVEASGLPTDLKSTDLALLGGFQRLAGLDEKNWQSAPPVPSELVNGGRYVVVLTGPMRLEDGDPDWRHDRTNGAVGQLKVTLADHKTIEKIGPVVAAVVGRPVMIGGWDSESRSPLPMVPCLPAGSVFFIESDQPPPTEPCRVGSRIAFGYGGCRIGAWPESSKGADS